MKLRRRMTAVAFATAAATMVWACGGAGATPTPVETQINVSVQEWAVLPAAGTAPSGTVKFTVNNTGPDDIHEFVVIKTDLPINELPTDDRGVVDEEGGPMEVMGEIEDLAVGATQDLSLNLEPGAYALICNIYDEDEGEAHYSMGMYAAFEVTE